MKLVRFEHKGQVEIGITDGAGIAALHAHAPDAPQDMIALIEAWPQVSARLSGVTDYPLSLKDVRLLAPVGRPGKIFGIGLNYADHVAESGMQTPEHQMWFTKAVTAVNGPYDPIELPLASSTLDYEAELVFIIGKRCRHVSIADAPGVIFGYCVGNDVSVRDWQMRTSQFNLGKSFDTHAPFGPWITTSDSINVADLEISSFVNGERRQHSRTSHLVFNCAAQVAHLSEAMTLEPGDVIFTGTPGGVGGAMKPPAWLKTGDRVRVEIEGLGAIENVVAPEKR